MLLEQYAQIDKDREVASLELQISESEAQSAGSRSNRKSWKTEQGPDHVALFGEFGPY